MERVPAAGRDRADRFEVDRSHPRDRRTPGGAGLHPSGPAARTRRTGRQGRSAVEESAGHARRHPGLGRHGYRQYASPLRVRHRGPAAAGPPGPARQRLLSPTAACRGSGARRRRGTRHRTDGAAAAQLVLPGTLRHHPTSLGRVRRTTLDAGTASLLLGLRRGDRLADRRLRARPAWRPSPRSTCWSASITTSHWTL